jgi:ketosteroid isomerase-like protein
VLSSAEVLELFERLPRDGELVSATLYSVEAHGDSVLASGSFRMREGGALVEFQVHWLYDFREGELVQATSYPARVDALAALTRRT